MTIQHIDLYYHPWYAFEFHWKPKDKKGVVELDAVTGEMRQGQALASRVTKMMNRDALFDIGADTVGLIVPAEYAVANGILYGPGCMTPSEIIAAENAGITFIKLIPGDMLGPKFVSGIKAIFPNLSFMVTGGVDTTRESISSWFTAGVKAVGMGSNLVSKKRMDDKDYAGIEATTREVLALIQDIK